MTQAEIDAGRPCECDRYTTTEVYNGTDCPLCWLWHDPGKKGQKRRAIWAAMNKPGGYATPKKPVAPLTPLEQMVKNQIQKDRKKPCNCGNKDAMRKALAANAPKRR